MTMTLDNYFRLQHLQKNMKAGILPNICELRVLSSVAAFDYDA